MSATKALVRVGEGDIGGARIQTVDGRELHGFLEVGGEYATWAKRQIERGKFKKDRDFIVFFTNEENPRGGRPSTEYHLSLDMAKHVALMSQTDRGHQVREYFIEVERSARMSPYQAQIPQTLEDALILAAQEIKERKLLAEKNENLTKSLAVAGRQLDELEQYLEHMFGTDSTMLIKDLSRYLNYKGAGPSNIYKILREIGVLYKNENGDNVPFAQYLQGTDYFKCVSNEIMTNHGPESKTTSRVTFRGALFIKRKLDAAGYGPFPKKPQGPLRMLGEAIMGLGRMVTE